MVPEGSMENSTVSEGAGEGRNIERVLKLELPVSVIIDEKEVNLEFVLDLGPGGIIEFDKASADALDIVVAGKKIGRGEVVKVGENFGVVVREIGGVRERVEQLGGLPQK